MKQSFGSRQSLRWGTPHTTGLLYTIFSLLISLMTSSSGQTSGDCANCSGCSGIWSPLDNETGEFQARHECGYVRIGDLFYLVGGRGDRTLAIYNPVTEEWTTGAKPPHELHHFQAVEVDGELWIAGAFIGKYPRETPFEQILIYNPTSNSWRTGPTVPRPRGSCGVVVRDRTLYLICGITNGHLSGHVKWVDAYNLDTGEWTQLPDAPRARDHFYAVLIDDRIWNAAGRRTARDSDEGVRGNLVHEVDYFDFNAGDNGMWGTLTGVNIPIPRAGTAAINFNGKILVSGGESLDQRAHNEMELLDPETSLWTTMPPMLQARHGGGLIQYGNSLYVASGHSGSGELNTQERYDCGDITPNEIEIQPSNHNASATSGSDETLTLSFTNLSESEFAISDITIDNPVFTISGTPPTVLTAGETLELQVIFSPGTGGSETFLGTLTLTTNSETNPTLVVLLSGERTPEASAPGSIIYAINSGGDEYTASDGTVYATDTLYTGGNSFSVGSSNNPIAGTEDDTLYHSERTGSFSYVLPIANGTYEVTLRFAEIYWKRDNARSFSVNSEGAEILPATDLHSMVGHDAAYDQTYTIEVTDGVLNLDFVTLKDNSKVSAILVRSQVPLEITVTSVEKLETTLIVNFTAPSGLTNFSLLSSQTLNNFEVNPEIAVTFNEISDQVYQATIDRANLGDRHFFVIEYTRE